MKILAISFFTFFTSFGFAQHAQKSEQIIVDGMARQFVTYMPLLANTTGKLPIIISLHGRLGKGKQMMGFADFRPIAERGKFIIVCPDGINRSWNDGRATPAEKKGINDVKFIDQLITYIINTYNGDARRVYVTGMSNGGFMSSRLACELSNRIAAIAVVGASIDENAAYQPVKPVPVMYIQGTKDPLVPFAGGPIKGEGAAVGHDKTLKLWAFADHCIDKPVITNLPDMAHDGTSVIKEEYTNPGNGIKVIGYTITNGGHTWPNGTQYLPKVFIGTVSHNLNACEVIWEFFKRYELVE